MLKLRPYGVNTEIDGVIYGYPNERAYSARLIEKDGRLLARFPKPVNMVSRGADQTKRVVEEIELDPGPNGKYRDILFLLDSLNEDDLFLFRRSDPGSFRKHTFILVDVDLKKIENGVLNKPGLRPAFEQVFGSQAEAGFFGIVSSTYQNRLSEIAEDLPWVSVVNLNEPGVRQYLGALLDQKIAVELAAPWGDLLRKKLIEARATSCAQALGGEIKKLGSQFETP